MTPDVWRGTSDSRATLTARAASTPAERLEWLEESLRFAHAAGALGQIRDRRRRQTDQAWGSAGSPTAG